MPVMQDRRRFLATLSSTAAAGLLDAPNVLCQEAPLETTRRLRDAGMIKSSPNKILADGADWRFWNELKRELKA